MSDRLPSRPPEPPRSSDTTLLAPGFQWRLGLVLKDANARCVALRLPYRFELFEGVRTDERQQWLFGSGRTYEGPWLTNAQTAERGWHFFAMAGDCVPRVVLAGGALGDFTWDGPAQLWQILFDAATNNGCTTGLHWPHADRDHVQPAGVRISPSSAARALYASGDLDAVWAATGMAK